MMKANEKIIQLDSNSKVEIFTPDYESITKLLAQFVELYKVCDNKQLIDKLLESLFSPPLVINGKPDLTVPGLTYEEVKKYS